ncbi:Gfo/Idh/MocA family protein [Konateibacter massiliensis]|uniref:Gfo/Idh/MocA family protein n=1 Tax=Konateibacter massiliensis TaxID=2002841 RepID=UPI000C14D78C|nr:Gfo/Idh/MocA family oxidoreductase [Konateibacter massiliensis]
MEKTIVNWGIIGCAGIAEKSVIPGILSADNARLYALSSRGAGKKLEEFKEKFNPAKTYTSYEEMLDDPEIDAVYIPLPNGLHCEWAIKAAEKKKHVLCEKPLAVNEEEVKAMQDAADKNGVLLMEAFAYRQSPLTKKVKELTEAGAIGKLKFIEAHFSFLMNRENDVRLNKALSGGATYDVGCYNLNIIRHIAGSEPTSIYAVGEIGEDSQVDVSSCITMEFEGGLKAVSYCAFNCAGRSEYTIVGEKGVIRVPVQFNASGDTPIIITKETGVEEIMINCPHNYMLEVEQFGRCILEGEAPLITYEDSLNNAKVIDEALRQILK